jgi:DNA adenine methylase
VADDGFALVPPPLHTGRVPHVVPYQGSKRKLAGAILGVLNGRSFATLHEPCAGSAAVTLAAAARGTAQRFVIGDSLLPLCEVWRAVHDDPAALADGYAALWFGAISDPAAAYLTAREAFNSEPTPAGLLYLLARCVKGAVRFNQQGRFNQAADQRRLGMTPDRMRKEVATASKLLRGGGERGRCAVVCADAADLARAARPGDLVYLDPPWQGTTAGSDHRYHQGLARERLLTVLEDLDRRHVAWLLSYDGRTGARSYGEPLPEGLGARRLELTAGRSAQATLHGRRDVTVESLYVSRALT